MNRHCREGTHLELGSNTALCCLLGCFNKNIILEKAHDRKQNMHISKLDWQLANKTVGRHFERRADTFRIHKEV